MVVIVQQPKRQAHDHRQQLEAAKAGVTTTIPTILPETLQHKRPQKSPSTATAKAEPVGEVAVAAWARWCRRLPDFHPDSPCLGPTEQLKSANTGEGDGCLLLHRHRTTVVLVTSIVAASGMVLKLTTACRQESQPSPALPNATAARATGVLVCTFGAIWLPHELYGTLSQRRRL